MPTYNPAAPWNGPYPVTVIDEDTGMEWEAYGLRRLKKRPVNIPLPEDDDDIGPDIELGTNDPLPTTTQGSYEAQRVCVDGVFCGWVTPENGFKPIFPDRETVLNIICDEDAFGTPCEGIITHVIGDFKTGVPTRRVSQCTEICRDHQNFTFDFASVFGSNVIDDVSLAPNGTIIPMSNTLSFNLPKDTDVIFESEWTLNGRNVSITGQFEISVDGGPWIRPTGGQDNLALTVGVQGEEGASERETLTLTKGAHTIAARYVLVDDLIEIDEADTTGTNLGRAQSEMSVSYVKDVCQEVEL